MGSGGGLTEVTRWDGSFSYPPRYPRKLPEGYILQDLTHSDCIAEPRMSFFPNAKYIFLFLHSCNSTVMVLIISTDSRVLLTSCLYRDVGLSPAGFSEAMAHRLLIPLTDNLCLLYKPVAGRERRKISRDSPYCHFVHGGRPCEASKDSECVCSPRPTPHAWQVPQEQQAVGALYLRLLQVSCSKIYLGQ